MTATLDLPRDEDGRVVGYGVGKEASLRDWRFEKDAREFADLTRGMKRKTRSARRSPTKVDWDAQPLGVETDHAIGARVGVHFSVVACARRRRGIAPTVEMRRWTAREDRKLVEHYRVHGFGRLRELAKSMGRTAAALKNRMATVLRLSTNAPRPEWPRSVRSLCAEWGYERPRFVNAAARVGIEIEKAHGRGRGGGTRITRVQADAIRAELARHPDAGRLHVARAGEWGRGGHASACVSCGRSDRPRLAHDRCGSCDARHRRQKGAPSARKGC